MAKAVFQVLFAALVVATAFSEAASIDTDKAKVAESRFFGNSIGGLSGFNSFNSNSNGVFSPPPQSRNPLLEFLNLVRIVQALQDLIKSLNEGANEGVASDNNESGDDQEDDQDSGDDVANNGETNEEGGDDGANNVEGNSYDSNDNDDTNDGDSAVAATSRHGFRRGRVGRRGGRRGSNAGQLLQLAALANLLQNDNVQNLLSNLSTALQNALNGGGAAPAATSRHGFFGRRRGGNAGGQLLKLAALASLLQNDNVQNLLGNLTTALQNALSGAGSAAPAASSRHGFFGRRRGSNASQLLKLAALASLLQNDNVQNLLGNLTTAIQNALNGGSAAPAATSRHGFFRRGGGSNSAAKLVKLAALANLLQNDNVQNLLTNLTNALQNALNGGVAAPAAP